MSGYWRRNISRTWTMFQVYRSQVGKSPDRDRLFAMLLDATDLPEGEWIISNELAFITGAGRSPTAETVRARKIGSITAIRRLKSNGPNRLLSLTLIPFASEADAIAYFPNSITRSGRKPFSKVTDTEEGFVEGREVPGLPDATLYEMRYVGPGNSGGERVISRVLGNMVVHVNCRDTVDLWPWSEVATIAESQSTKIRRCLSEA